MITKNEMWLIINCVVVKAKADFMIFGAPSSYCNDISRSNKTTGEASDPMRERSVTDA